MMQKCICIVYCAINSKRIDIRKMRLIFCIFIFYSSVCIKFFKFSFVSFILYENWIIIQIFILK